MKRSVLHGMGGSLLLVLWLLLVQFLSAVLSVVSITALGISHLAGPTPLWQWTFAGALVCVLWLVMGMATPVFVQLRLVDAVALLTVWAIATSWMRNAYLLFMPQRSCGGMLRQMVQLLLHDAGLLLEEYHDLPIGCFVLTALFGAGLLLRQATTAEDIPEEVADSDG